MAIVYPEAVHYKEDGQWKDIDNTLQAKGSGDSLSYTTTVGSWGAEFPQKLCDGAQVTITKDGYTVCFGMAGELRYNSVSGEANATYSMRDNQGSAHTMAISNAKESRGQIHEFDYSKEKEEAQHPEVIRDKLKSRVSYTDVYDNTDIIYDVNSYQLKESVVINKYDAAVCGYLYTLDTGTLVPVLNEDGSIDLLGANNEIVMSMPAPFMVDDAGATSDDVLVTLEQKENYYLLAYQMPMEWLADEDRAWPVVLDPVVVANSSYSNILDQFVAQYYSPSYNNGALMCGYSADFGIMRSFIQYVNLPTLSSADVVVNASLSLLYLDGTSGTTTIEAHKVLSTWDSQTITWANQPSINETIEDYDQVSTSNRYSWEITDVVREWYTTENTGVMLKAPDSVESAAADNWKKFYSIDYSKYNDEIWPYLTIVYRNMNGLESYWDYTSASAGRAGTGYVNNYTGNLTWVHDDIGFDGNRMPVSISHIYNSNDKDTNAFGLGNGWRTNFHQTVAAVTVSADSAMDIDASYVWTDGDGTKHYFVPTDTSNTYTDEDGLELTLTVGSSTYTITDKYGNTSNFDSKGRLTSMVKNQATKSSITISYTDTTNCYISKIQDGVGRSYNFTYSSNLLTRISYTGTGTTEIAYISFGYSNSLLTSITNQDGKSCSYSYTNNLLTNATDVDDYRIQYTYSTTAPKRVVAISEYDGSTLGSSLTIEYAHNQTTFTDHNGNIQITQFNDWGNVISVQDGEGRAEFAQYAMNSYDESSNTGNQLTISSKMQNTVVNLLNDSSFENGGLWTATCDGITQVNNIGGAYIGTHYLKLTQTETDSGEGVSAPSFAAVAGKTYTFSGYIKTGNLSAYLALTDGTATVTSDIVAAGSDYTRVEVSYTAAADKTVTPQLIVSGSGSLHIDCVQLEQAATASRYNLIQNGDFRTTGYWSSNAGRTAVTSAVPQLSSNVYKITGSPTAAKYVSQTVNVSGEEGDTFVLAGWAKGDAAPLTAENREFGLNLIFNYTDGTSSTHRVSFNPDCDSANSWQYAAMPAVATTAYSSVTVQFAYCYNVNTVYFDGIQLYREEFGNSYTYDEDTGELTSVVDLQKQKTEYKFNANGDLTSIVQDGITKMAYEYDDCHNVIMATTATGIVYELTYDDWGNNTSVSITNGTTTITSTAEYTADANYILSTTDALGKKTIYNYNADTGMLESIRYPGDTEETQTEYTYDSMYRLAMAAVTTDAGSTLTATYTYTNDLLTSLTTGSTVYSISYGYFGQTESIKAGDRLLVSYSYTEDQNRYLKGLDYGNGDGVKYEYDNYGRLILETFGDGSTVTYEYDNTGALATVTDSATGIKTTYYYDFTDRLMKYTETGANSTHSVTYTYDSLNNLTQYVESINGTDLKTSYTYDEDNRVSSISHSNLSATYTYDDLGRVGSILSKYIGETVISDVYTYYTNSGRVHTLTLTAANYSATYTYTYDDNGNILSVSDGSNTTSYVYDSANQLIRENNQAAGKSWAWTYDDAGNILTKSEYAYTTGTLGSATDTITYTYSTGSWGDLLTKFDGVKVTTDTIGNTTRFGSTTYQWEHGRELARLSQQAPLAIVGQPEDCTGILDDAITFSVNALGDDLTYQWQVSTNGSSWYSSGATGNKTAAISGFTITSENDGKYYRCKVEDSLGNVRYSEAAQIVLVPIVIDAQPEDFFGALGEDISFSVTARGEDLNYQWQVSTNGGTSWSTSGATGNKTNTISSFNVTEARVGRLYRCKITDGDGNVLYSEPGAIYLDTATVLEQPEDHYGFVGGKAVFTVKAGGNGLTYFWQVSTNGGSTWSNSAAGGYATASMWVKITENNPGYLYRCKITDSYGNVVYSEPGQIKIATDSWEFTYNADGLRTSRTNGYKTYQYVYHGSQLTQMTVGSDVLKFGYDASGSPAYVIWNGSKYFYTTNLQGDVVAIVSTNGNPVVSYTYDAWGNILSITGTRADNLGKLNPLRYRGYVYDQDTGLYYLQSRYYDPTWGRFLNADVVFDFDAGLQGYNLFIYCGSNPVNRIDISGADSREINADEENVDDEAPKGGILGGANSGNYSNTGGAGAYVASGMGSKTSTYSGPGQAPKTGEPGSIYQQSSSDGQNTLISQTLYNEHGLPGVRIDYAGRDHNIGLPHVHIFSYGVINGHLRRTQKRVIHYQDWVS